MRAMNHTRPNSPQDPIPLDPELLALLRWLKRAYPPAAPESQFRQALYDRVLEAARQQKEHPTTEPMMPLLRRAVVGAAAALSVAGLALVLLKGRSLSPTLLQSRLGTAHGG